MKSEKFEELKDKYEKNYITIATLKKWVQVNEKRLGAGITAEEFQEITGQGYDQ